MSIPPEHKFDQKEIFNNLGLEQTVVLIQKLLPSGNIITDEAEQKRWDEARSNIEISGDPFKGSSIADIEDRNKKDRRPGTDVMDGVNIGDFHDWYSDTRFAQQQFTGTNPVTITVASDEWLERFRQTAKTQKNQKVVEILSSAGQGSFYIQDSSYFRDAIKAGPKEVIRVESPTGNRWACAAVSLFQLHPDGRLHPLAIVIDYKGSIEQSVTIFNKRLCPSDSTSSEKNDWPWRYAKTCAQVTDWLRHQLTIHLTNTHFMEEVIIVATNRTMDSRHPVFRLLEPHWLKTLSVNAGARSTLVPGIVLELVGVDAPKLFNFVNHAFDTFDFVGQYVPKDLASRGFPLSELDSEKFRNYAYARNMILVWKVLRNFVASMLALHYQSDASVVADSQIKSWYKEIQTAGKVPTFPTITTRDELIDAVTMCIHIASPQHTAVNYLQNFYYNFVIAKPAALCNAPPTNLSELLAYTEKDLVASLPINRAREWLLAAQLPWLLSFRVAEDNNILNYAISLWKLYKYKTQGDEQKIKEIANKFYQDLRTLIAVFAEQSRQQIKEETFPYMVLDPTTTAISVLI